MKGPSPTTRALLDRIVFEPGREKRELPAAEIVSVLGELGESGSPCALPSLLPFLVHMQKEKSLAGTLRSLFRAVPAPPPPSVAEAAAEAVGKMLGRWRMGDLPRLDESVRSSWGTYVAASWDEVKSLDGLPAAEGRPHAIHGIASCHRNGRVRELALRELAQATDGNELPFLLIRLNDWVEPIRRLAEQEVLIRAQPSYAQHFVACLPLVTRLGDLQRADHRRVSSAVYSLLASPQALPALLEGIGHADRSIRRGALRHLQAQDVPWSDVLQRTAQDPDLPIRLWTAREVPGRLPESEAERRLEALANDPHLAVRMQALRGLMALSRERSIAHLRRALLDRSGSVRHFARYYMHDLGGEEGFAAHYRRILETGDSSAARAATGGLGETGTQEDVQRVTALLSSTSSRDVQVALRALARLSFEACRSRIRDHLGDPRPGVSALAAHLLTPSTGPEDFEALRAIAVGEGAVTSKLHTLRLVRRMDTWPRLRLLLAFVAPRQGVLAEALEQTLAAWCHAYARGLYAPKPATALELGDAKRQLGGVVGWLSAAMRGQIHAILRGEESPRT